jgi:hypothetical protein
MRARLAAYSRRLNGRRISIAINFADKQNDFAFAGAGQIRLLTHLDRQDEHVDRSVRLRPHEGVILEMGG